MLGSVISAALLTILPEMLRAFADYRMLAYAVVLILVMIFTNNPTIRVFTNRVFVPIKRIARKPGHLSVAHHLSAGDIPHDLVDSPGEFRHNTSFRTNTGLCRQSAPPVRSSLAR